MFKEERQDTSFQWSMLGDLTEGRPNMGPTTDVAVYRLMQFTLRDVLIRDFDVATANRVLYDAGWHAGRLFAENVVGKRDDFNEFLADLQARLKELGIGVLKVEKADIENHRFTLTVAEDLDCSGLPDTSETICVYDEGFISGLLFHQTGMSFTAKEVDCWCSGDRVCRFDVRLESDAA